LFSLTAGFGEGSGKRPKSSEKQESRFHITSMDAIGVKTLSFTRCRPCELHRLGAVYACGYRTHGYWPAPSTAGGSEPWAIVPFLLWPRLMPRIQRKSVQPLPLPPSVRRSLPRCPSRGSTACTCGPSRNGTARCVPVERSSLQSSNECTATVCIRPRVISRVITYPTGRATLNARDHKLRRTDGLRHVG
jgi:hypothetical protein